MAKHWAPLAVLLACVPQGLSLCLDDGVAENLREYIQDDQGNNLPIGLLEVAWQSSELLTEMTSILIREALGYHTETNSNIGANGASPIYALAGCLDFDNSNIADKRCGEQETRIHVSVDSWVGSYASAQNQFEKDFPTIAAMDLGSMGYAGEESMYVSRAVLDAAYAASGLALDFYKSYNVSHHTPQQYFDTLAAVNFTELTLCSTTDFSNGQRMYDYARFSGDWAGVQQQGAADSTIYHAVCPDGKWWHAPMCRGNAPNCIPVFTAGNGWKLQAMMQWTAAYDFPAAIAIPAGWSMFVKHVQTYKCLHYWWIPDSTFIDMLPEQLVFPRHSASAWLAGDKKTGGLGSYVSKMVSSNLQGKAGRVQEFVSQMSFEMPEVSALLLEVKQSGSIYNVSCDWIRANRAGFILETGHHTEEQSASVMRQVLCAVRYMHSQNVCHRDIKHTNTLMLSQAAFGRNVVKVVDFGLACHFTPGEVLRQCAGTAIYVAPQVLECRYDHRIDLWSCGVLLYIMLCGFPPFRGETDAAVMTAIRRGNYSFPSSDWSCVSASAKSLIRSLLKMKVKERISVADALEHDWIQDPPRDAPLDRALERIRRFMAHHRQTQDLNPQEHQEEAGLAKCSSQSSIATRIPAATGAWFQQQLAAFTAAVGSVMSTKKAGQKDLAYDQQDMSPTQAFRLKHVEEDDPKLPQELGPVSMVFRQKHVEEEGFSPKHVEAFQPKTPEDSHELVEPEVVPSKSAPVKIQASQPAVVRLQTVPLQPMPTWLEHLPGNSLMDLNSTEKPFVDGYDDLPPPPEELQSGDTQRSFVGQPLEFYSKTAQRWLPCEVINVQGDAIMVNVKPNTWLSLQDQKERIREPELQKGPASVHDLDHYAGACSHAGRLEVGQAVEYLSTSARRWIPCEVTHVDAWQAVQLDVKPNCWIPVSYQRKHIRLANKTPQVPRAEDVKLEYYSLTLSAWIPCLVLEQDAESGNIVIDALPYAWITPAQQASYLRTATPGQHVRVPVVGDRVVYWSASHQRWIPSIITDVGDGNEVELEIKPGVWIQREAQQRVLRWCSDQL